MRMHNHSGLRKARRAMCNHFRVVRCNPEQRCFHLRFFFFANGGIPPEHFGFHTANFTLTEAFINRGITVLVVTLEAIKSHD